MNLVNNCLKYTQQTLFPSLCLLCDAPVSEALSSMAMDLCPDCAAELPYIEQSCAGCALPLPPVQARGLPSEYTHPGILCGCCLQQRPEFETARAVFLYQPPIDGLILGLKYNGRLSHARLLGQLMAIRLAALVGAERPDLLLPVPLHRRRLRERGFNQSLELARHVGQGLGLPLWPDACNRQRNTVSQAGLPAGKRRRNVRNAFIGKRSLQGRYVAVIDDVMTTGYTANELAEALYRAGARRVDIWVCARASF